MASKSQPEIISSANMASTSQPEIISSTDMASTRQPEISLYQQLEKYVLTPGQLDANNYVRPPQNEEEDFILGGRGMRNVMASRHKCMRCFAPFQMRLNEQNYHQKVECKTHAGKFVWSEKKWNCCSRPYKKAPGCVKHDVHVHKDNIDYGVLFEYDGHGECPVGFVSTQGRLDALNSVTSQEQCDALNIVTTQEHSDALNIVKTQEHSDALNIVTTQEHSDALNIVNTQEQTDACNIVALKCEMVFTCGGLEVAKVSIVDSDLSVLVDTYVRPTNTIVDVNTPFSGITGEHMQKATETLSSVQKLLMKHIHRDTIIVGHSLECDLKALRMIHLKVVDTAVVYLNAQRYKVSLQKLSQDILGMVLQNGTRGRSSAKSAKAAMMLMLHTVGIKKPATTSRSFY